jgi:hypothetical protein
LKSALCALKILQEQHQDESYWLTQGEANHIG